MCVCVCVCVCVCLFTVYSCFIVSGDSLREHDGFRFSTKDKDLDGYSGDCAKLFKGGWWYTECHTASLNGQYLGGKHESFANGIVWDAWKGFFYSLKKTQMKIRPMK